MSGVLLGIKPDVRDLKVDALHLTDYGVKLFRPNIQPMFMPQSLTPAVFSNPELAEKYTDKSTKRMRQVAEELGSEMAFVQYSEQAILAGLFGNLAGAVKTTITAAATTQTSIATMNAYTYINAGRSAGNVANMDTTPTGTAFVWTGTPGSTPNYNTYTAPHAFLLTASAATAETIASQSIGLAVTVGDFMFIQGSSSAGGGTTGNQPMWALNAMYIGLSTATYTSSQASILSGEPTSTGGYQRIGYTGSQTNGAASLYGIPNTAAVWGTPTAASPSVVTSAQSLSFAASSAAWSTGSSNLVSAFIADALTLAGANIIAVGALGTAQAVNAASITLSFAASAITVSLT